MIYISVDITKCDLISADVSKYSTQKYQFFFMSFKPSMRWKKFFTFNDDWINN